MRKEMTPSAGGSTWDRRSSSCSNSSCTSLFLFLFLVFSFFGYDFVENCVLKDATNYSVSQVNISPSTFDVALNRWEEMFSRGGSLLHLQGSAFAFAIISRRKRVNLVQWKWIIIQKVATTFVAERGRGEVERHDFNPQRKMTCRLFVSRRLSDGLLWKSYIHIYIHIFIFFVLPITIICT